MLQHMKQLHWPDFLKNNKNVMRAAQPPAQLDFLSQIIFDTDQEYFTMLSDLGSSSEAHTCFLRSKYHKFTLSHPHQASTRNKYSQHDDTTLEQFAHS